MTVAVYEQCARCHQRVFSPATPTGQVLPAVNFGPDPAGTIAIWPGARHLHGRCLDRDEATTGTEQRFAVHDCQAPAALPVALL